MNLQNFTNKKLFLAIENLVRSERKITLEILNYLKEIDRRKAFAELGFTSLFEFATKYLHYSESAAGRRIAAMRLIRNSSLQVIEQIEKGEVTLSSLSQVSSFIYAKEKHTGIKLSSAQKDQLIALTQNKSQKEVTSLLLQKSAEANLPTRESVKQTITSTNEEVVILKFAISQETLKKLEKVKELYSNQNKTSLSEIFDTLLDQAITQDKTKKVVKATPAAEVSEPKNKNRYIKSSVKRAIYQNALGTCQYISPVTGKRCEARKFLQFAHIKAHAKGGDQSQENLKLLCRTHNLYEANLEFGLPFIEKKILEKRLTD